LGGAFRTRAENQALDNTSILNCHHMCGFRGRCVCLCVRKCNRAPKVIAIRCVDRNCNENGNSSLRVVPILFFTTWRLWQEKDRIEVQRLVQRWQSLLVVRVWGSVKQCV